MHIVLLGDSIFDNAPYVSDGDSVEELLKQSLPNTKVSLLAVDGSVSLDVERQLKHFPADATHVFVSVGGNDALKSQGVLNTSASVGDALDILYLTKEKFRAKYIAMLKAVLSISSEARFCTIYNKVPGLSERAYTALALFNEVILEELASRELAVIDLRVICNEEKDYSEISPIEPSKLGGEKIVQRISRLSQQEYLKGQYVV